MDSCFSFSLSSFMALLIIHHIFIIPYRQTVLHRQSKVGHLVKKTTFWRPSFDFYIPIASHHASKVSANEKIFYIRNMGLSLYDFISHKEVKSHYISHFCQNTQNRHSTGHLFRVKIEHVSLNYHCHALRNIALAVLTHWGWQKKDNIFKGIFFNGYVLISQKILPKFVPKVRINNIPALVQIMAWHWPGDKPLSEPIMVGILIHVCVTLPQWIKTGTATFLSVT